jgi:MtN3 and saliva related transmembrane protein
MAGHPLAIAVGTLAALLSIISFAPQILKIAKDRDASAVSLRTCMITVTGFAVWMAYGVMIGAWPVVASNLACLLMAAAVLALKWRFSRPARR